MVPEACPFYAVCYNTEGGFNCSCDPGYDDVSGSCVGENRNHQVLTNKTNDWFVSLAINSLFSFRHQCCQCRYFNMLEISGRVFLKLYTCYMYTTSVYQNLYIKTLRVHYWILRSFCICVQRLRVYDHSLAYWMLFSSDINECEASPCPDRADCTNTAGSFFCQCVTGFFNSSGLCIGNKALCV